MIFLTEANLGICPYSPMFTCCCLTSVCKSIQLVKPDLLYQHSQGNTMWVPNLQAAFLKTVKHYNCHVYFGTEDYVLNNKTPSTSITEVAAVLHARELKTPSVCATCCMLVNYIPKLPDWPVCRWSPTAKCNVYSKLKRALVSLGEGKKTQNISASHITLSVPKACYYFIIHVHCAHFQNH